MHRTAVYLGSDARLLNLRVEIEESLEAGFQLLLDVFLAAFEHVHGHVRVAAIFQFDRGFAHLLDFFQGQ
jgi:hypothetical protein